MKWTFIYLVNKIHLKCIIKDFSKKMTFSIPWLHYYILYVYLLVFEYIITFILVYKIPDISEIAENKINVSIIYTHMV